MIVIIMMMMKCYIIYTQFNLGFIICKLGSDLFIVDQVITELCHFMITELAQDC